MCTFQANKNRSKFELLFLLFLLLVVLLPSSSTNAKHPVNAHKGLVYLTKSVCHLRMHQQNFSGTRKDFASARGGSSLQSRPSPASSQLSRTAHALFGGAISPFSTHLFVPRRLRCPVLTHGEVNFSGRDSTKIGPHRTSDILAHWLRRECSGQSSHFVLCDQQLFHYY